jgi:hypothetical protein
MLALAADWIRWDFGADAIIVGHFFSTCPLFGSETAVLTFWRKEHEQAHPSNAGQAEPNGVALVAYASERLQLAD